MLERMPLIIKMKELLIKLLGARGYLVHGVTVQFMGWSIDVLCMVRVL
jgi:hypothetical protein